MGKKVSQDKIALIFFVASISFVIFGYGVLVGKFKIFPYQILKLIDLGKKEIQAPWYLKKYDGESVSNLNTSQAYQGLNLVTRIAGRNTMSVDILDMDGNQLHSWNIDWFKIWPDPQHLPEDMIPKSRPGSHVHGAILLKNGNLVFNFDHLGLVCLNLKSEIVWKLPYCTHHSLHLHDDGHLWACGQERSSEPENQFPFRNPPFDKYTVLEITQTGEILNKWSIEEMILKNDFNGLLRMGYPYYVELVKKDLIHLNDVEPFPNHLKEGFFKKGDVMVSFRNINTVFVFNRFTEKIKYITTGHFVWQHDPDFIDGNCFSVFDNRGYLANGQHQSRISIFNALDNEYEVYFKGNDKIPFYTDALGKHQWLPNGNLLISESIPGRAFEINDKNELVWEYYNVVDKNTIALMEEVQRISLDYKDLFIRKE